MSLNPAPASHPAGLRLTRHQRRFTQFTRPVFPSPVASRMEREPSGFPLSFEPRRPEPDNARQGGDRPTEHGPETTLYDISRTSNPACLLVVCDLASHGVIQQCAVARAGRRRSWLPVLLHIGASITSADSASPPTREPMSRRRWRWLSARRGRLIRASGIGRDLVAQPNDNRTPDVGSTSSANRHVLYRLVES
jgi:hypothetical protein